MIRFFISLLALLVLLPALSGDSNAREKITDLSDRALIQRMDDMVLEMQETLDEAFQGLESAKDSKNVQRWVAIQSLLTPMKGLFRLGQQAALRGKESSAKSDRTGLEAAFITIKVARVKMRELEVQLRTAGREGASTIEEGTDQVTLLSQPLTILGPVYTPWGDPVPESTRGSSNDPGIPHENEPLWGDHPNGGELPVFEEPPSASPFL